LEVLEAVGEELREGVGVVDCVLYICLLRIITTHEPLTGGRLVLIAYVQVMT